MLRRLRILCAFVALVQTAAWAQTNGPADLILRVRRNVTDTLDRLPRYMCSLTINRAQYAPDPRHALSCDGLLGQQTRGQNTPRLFETDRLRLDVIIAAGNELYSWVGEERFDNRDVFDFVRQGALQTGGFSSFLSSIFRGSAATFSYNGDIAADGRTMAEFGFQVPREKSNYAFGNRREQVIAGYEGTFRADPKTGELVRLLVRTSSLPADTGACQASTTLDYGRIHLKDAEFLLPRETRLEILNTDGSALRNSTVYSGCHEFLGESTLRFDEPADASPAATGNSGAAASTPATSVLPTGREFKLIFTQPIDTEIGAAGEPIRARLMSAIRDASSKALLVPAGSEVTARIMRLEHFPGPPTTVRMLVKLETLDIGGKPVRFAATMAPAPQAGARIGSNSVGSGVVGTTPPGRVIQLRTPLGSFDTLADPYVGVFEFRDVKPNFVIKSGMESTWITAER